MLAHPSRKEAWKQFNSSWSDTLLGIEFWNRKTDGWAPSRQALTLLQEAHLLPFAGLDFHDQRQFFPMALFLEIADPVVSEAIVLEALRERHCVSKVLGLSAAALEGGLKARALNSAEVWRRRAANYIGAWNQSLDGKAFKNHENHICSSFCRTPRRH